jgi:hypothetical protein
MKCNGCKARDLAIKEYQKAIKTLLKQMDKMWDEIKYYRDLQ